MHTIPKEYCTLRDGTQHGRIILGGWQLSEGHSEVQKQQETISGYIENGIDVIDCADIYTGVEETIGRVLSGITGPEKSQIRVHTKHVPDLLAIQERGVTAGGTRALIERSLQRLGAARLDLVQFHQWDYTIDTYKLSIATLLELQNEGKISGLGITNSSLSFLEVLERECGFIPLTTQNQYNIIDRRPEKYLFDHARVRNIGFYAYGTLMGGLLSEKYFRVPQPVEPLDNRSIRKYMRIIMDWGDWELFQELLETLYLIGKRYDMKISEIAMRWALDNPSVTAIICGARHPTYASTINNVFKFSLSEEDKKLIEEVYRKGKEIEGDCFDLERYESRHRDIMKFNLNDK